MSTTEDNGNIGAGITYIKPTTSSSTEDLSEYTDADESISAPTEFLAEFLSAVMLKDYVTALKYCKLILQYEPNNVTAKEFYPLIVEKLQILNAEEQEDDESEPEDDSESSTSTSTSGTSSEIDSDDLEPGDDSRGFPKQGDKSPSTDGDATTGSYSSLEEDDEAETVDQLAALAARYRVDNFRLESNGNRSIYDTALTDNVKLNNIEMTVGSTAATGNNVGYGISSDSESPTEPVLSQLQSTSSSGITATSISASRLVPI